MGHDEIVLSSKKFPIGNRELTVRECTLGDMEDQIEPFQKSIQFVTGTRDFADKVVGLGLHFLGHNEGVDAKFLKSRIPANVPRALDFIGRVLIAAGLEVRAKGEEAPQ